MKFDIIVIGAGASGLTAAYQAASTSTELNILVLEKETIPGRKLSAAGNGKCNLANQDFHSDCYFSESKHMIEEWTAHHSYKEILSFFETLGILLYQKNGYYYPVSNQGKQVTELLYQKSLDLGVTYALQTRATAIHSCSLNKTVSYQIDAIQENGNQISYETRCLILATGGKSAPKLGGCQDGYQLAENLKLACTPIYPVLSPIFVNDTRLTLAKGVRLNGTVTLKYDGDCSVKEFGQIQLNEKSLSGIVMMNLSCYLNSVSVPWQEDCLHIDLLPDFTWNQLMDFFLSQKRRFPMESLELLLQGILPKSFVRYLVARLHMNGTENLNSLSKRQWNKITSTLKKLTFTPIQKEDYEKAQVTGGGISLEEVEFTSFCSKKYPDFYITGELLDINGKCGGYNLTFAVLSGIQAATDITNKFGGRT